MLHYFKFRQDLLDPQPAREIYGPPPSAPSETAGSVRSGTPGPRKVTGRGKPEECPPIRAANAFGFDVLANFDITFKKRRDGSWVTEASVEIQSDFDYAPPDAPPEFVGSPLSQQYAWFWEKGQKIPHVISDNVYEQIRNQVKVSTFLFLKTDPNEVLLMTDIPLRPRRSWSAMTALIDTDWYPASYPWHAVLELDPREKRITIHKGEPICRLIPLRRDTYFARQMTPEGFDEFFARSQRWLTTHGRPPLSDADAAHAPPAGTLDITRTYVKQQIKSRFVVLD